VTAALTMVLTLTVVRGTERAHDTAALHRRPATR
jgi:hypothetical protein